jgi:CRP-like cAMP-binding protein
MVTLEKTPPATTPEINKKALVKEVLKEYMGQFASISEAELNHIIELIKVQEYPAGTILIREGQVSNKCYFVLRGCLRQYYLVDGIEKTTNFYTEGQPVQSTVSFDNQPSKSWLYCNEDVILIVGSPEDEMNFMEQMPQFETINRVGVEHEIKKNQEAFADFVINSPEERYLNLLETRPELLDRVPQYQLASFLGVTPESLSRIRKRITQK